MQQLPLLIIIDAQERRLAWLTRLFTFAHYRVHAVTATQQATAWYTQHRVAPRLILLGQISQYDHFVLRRFVEQAALQHNRNISVLFVSNYLPERVRMPSEALLGCFALLETVWYVMLRA